MAISKKRIDDYTGLPGFLDWKTMGGGGGGGVPTSGLGAAIVGALAAGAAGVAGAGATTKPGIGSGIINGGAVKEEDKPGTSGGAISGGTIAEEEKPVEPEEPVIAPDIQDKTEENVEKTISTSGLDFALKWAEDQQKAQWEREDTIRKEVQEREDSAYQRAVADMRKAGINPNLTGVNPAASGGGITSATGQNLQLYQAEMDKYMQELDQMFQENWKGDENDKDRFMDAIGRIIQIFGIISMFGKK